MHPVQPLQPQRPRQTPGVAPVRWLPALAVAFALASCEPATNTAGGDTDDSADVVAFTGATVWDGTGAPASAATIIARDGRIAEVGAPDDVDVPDGARVVELDGLFVTPGLINAHGHVGGTIQPSAQMSAAEIVDIELERYARFGVTTVNSLGGGSEASVPRRHALGASSSEPRARLLMAGEVVAGNTAEALAATERNAAMGVDYIKIRVDDNLGTTEKMSEETYTAVIERAHAAGLPLAAHLFYLDDAKGLLRAGADLVAHSIRDVPVDEEVIGLFLEHDICMVPTLTREVSTYVFGERPSFLDDPMLKADVDSAQVRTVEDPDRQAQIAASRAAAAYRTALGVAMENLAALAEGNVRIGFGTDTGPLGRFQGYFEHMELELMVEAGLTPEQAMLAATRDAAVCVGLDDVGTLEPGRWADLVAYEANPLESITNSKSLTRAFIGGQEVPRPSR